MTMTAPDANQLRERLHAVRVRIEAAAHRSGRSAQEIKLIAVTKTHPAEVLRQAIDEGLSELGENRVQEAEAKITEVGRVAARWHLIGHLQSNKVRRAVQLFDVIHSLDSAALARRLERMCVEEKREELPGVVQVDLGHEKNKTGIVEKELPALVSTLNDCGRL